MKRGICLTALYPQAMKDKDLLIRLIYKIARQGIFNCIEYYFEGSYQDMTSIRHMTDKMEIDTIYLAGFPMKAQKIDLSCKDEIKRRESVVFCKDLLTNARVLGAQKMLILSGPAWDESNPGEVCNQMKKSVLELLAVRHWNDPQITLEFFNDTGEPYLAFGHVSLVYKLLSKINQNEFGITYDTSHVAQLNVDIISTYELLGPWIKHLHLANSVSKIKSSPLYGDKHPLFGVRYGDFSEDDIIRILQTLKKKQCWKHLDVCSFEVISREDKSQDEYFNSVSEQAKYIFSHMGGE